MATFYLIPPRECLEAAVAEFVGRVLPGVAAPPVVTESFLAALEFEANRSDDTYFVHREDLPADRDVVSDLTDAFGAEPGDKVVEIGTAAGGRVATVRSCTILARVSEASPAR